MTVQRNLCDALREFFPNSLFREMVYHLTLNRKLVSHRHGSPHYGLRIRKFFYLSMLDRIIGKILHDSILNLNFVIIIVIQYTLLLMVIPKTSPLHVRVIICIIVLK